MQTYNKKQFLFVVRKIFFLFPPSLFSFPMIVASLISVFGFSCKHLILSPMYSPNALPLHPIMCPINLVSGSLQFRRCSVIHSSCSISPLDNGVDDFLRNLWEKLRQGAPSTESLHYIHTSCRTALVLCRDGLFSRLMVSVMGLGVVRTEHPHLPIIYLCLFRGAKTSFYYII